MKKTGKIFIISGPSGVGKDTIIKGVLKKIPDLMMVKSYTTRAKRQSDEVGNRHFVSLGQFQKMISQGKILEYKEYCGNFYGRVQEDIIKPLSQSKNIVMEVEVKGTLDYQKLFPKQVVSFFIKYQNPKQMLERLKKNRPEINPEDLQKRLQIMQQELGYEKYYSYPIINYEGNKEHAINKVAKIIGSVIK